MQDGPDYSNSTEAGVWKLGSGAWYRGETNDDHWKRPQDNRRNAMNALMKKVTFPEINLQSLENVLSTGPVLNADTTYTAIMCAANSSMHTIVR